ncbi:hypothetical protein D9M68_978010 [compost metagenome]
MLLPDRRRRRKGTRGLHLLALELLLTGGGSTGHPDLLARRRINHQRHRHTGFRIDGRRIVEARIGVGLQREPRHRIDGLALPVELLGLVKSLIDRQAGRRIGHLSGLDRRIG